MTDEEIERVALAICEAGDQEAGFFGVTAEEAAEAEANPMRCLHSCVACRNVARAAIAALNLKSEQQERE